MGFVSYHISSLLIAVCMTYVTVVIALSVGLRTSTLAVIVPAIILACASCIVFFANKSLSSNPQSFKFQQYIRVVILAQFVTALYISFSPYLFQFAINPFVFASLLGTGLLTLFILLFTHYSSLPIFQAT